LEASFFIRLTPLYYARFSKDAVQITSASAEPERPKSILVVDDDDLTLQLLVKLLASWEASVEVARNGKEALSKLATKDFDLLICDIRMPEMGGEELFHQIQQNGLLPTQRIIFLTADKSPSLKQFLDASGCQYLYKPIQFSNLCSEIQEVFSHEPSY
jgi:CheY-like chemotaxis protein